MRQRIAEGIYLPGSRLPRETDLAEEFGVSRSTVSAALSRLAGEGLISQQQGRRTEVLPPQELLKEKPIAVAYRTQLPGTPPEHVMLLRGVQDRLATLGYHYHLVPTVDSPECAPYVSGRVVLTADVPRLPERYSAVICQEALNAPDMIRALEDTHVPLVVVNLEEDIAVTCTCVNHRRITHGAVDVLAAMGHRRIAYLGRDPHLYFYAKALAGYLEGLAKWNLPRDDAIIKYCEQRNALYAYKATRQILNLDQPPTAIVAARDELAEGACDAIAEAGLVVGKRHFRDRIRRPRLASGETVPHHFP